MEGKEGGTGGWRDRGREGREGGRGEREEGTEEGEEGMKEGEREEVKNGKTIHLF